MESHQINKDRSNKEFWDELCGSTMARALGITGQTEKSLKRFDQAYLDFYPYLIPHVRPDLTAGRTVLEIGLGYGTLGQILAENAVWYQGLDIAYGPVKMMNQRLLMHGLTGRAVQGSALEMPFSNESFDCVVSIGCFHHTGDAPRCVHETYRLLKPGGRAVIMLYNQFSYRLWLQWPIRTFVTLLRDHGILDGQDLTSYEQRKAYDKDRTGRAAPETAFFSIRKVRNMFEKYSRVWIRKENCARFSVRGRPIIPREKLLPLLGRSLGLDLYVVAQK